MHKFGVFHPNFFYAPRNTVESAMTVEIEVYEPTGGVAQWQGGTTMSNNMLKLRWKGMARVQPDKDWRSRPREAAGEFTAVQAVRVQVGVNKNLYEASPGVLHPDASENFEKDWVVVVVSSPVIGTECMDGDRYVVRNALGSGNRWVHNMLCDATTKDEN